MSCCGGTVTWYHCYPQHCPSSDYCCCDYPCSGCCSGQTCPNCNGTGCTTTCGKGACCTCNENIYGFAFYSGIAATCYLSLACGADVYFASSNCAYAVGATRVDTNGSTSNLADLSPALFTALGHNLSEGIFTAGLDTTSSGYTCPCP